MLRSIASPGSLAEAIRRERGARSWSQGQLARRLDTGEKNIRDWEHGRRSPSMRHYERLCLLFDWPLPYDVDRDTPEYLSRQTRAVRSLAGAA